MQRNPDAWVSLERDTLAMDDAPVSARKLVYVMLNKPRGLVTTTSDEQGRETVFSCLRGAPLPRFVAVGRLDKASEGLLLFTNDTAWADRLTSPAQHVRKVYHVQVNCVAKDDLIRRLCCGAQDGDDFLSAKEARVLRVGEKNSWLEIVLDEGRNRHIRRLLGHFEVDVLRLVRIAIGTLQLGDLPKGNWRELTAREVETVLSPGTGGLSSAAPPPREQK